MTKVTEYARGFLLANGDLASIGGSTHYAEADDILREAGVVAGGEDALHTLGKLTGALRVAFWETKTGFELNVCTHTPPSLDQLRAIQTVSDRQKTSIGYEVYAHAHYADDETKPKRSTSKLGATYAQFIEALRMGGQLPDHLPNSLTKSAKYSAAEPRDADGRWSGGGGSSPTLTRVAKRAFTGETVAQKTPLSKQEAGALGEKIALAYIKDVLGFSDGRPANSQQANFPIDALYDHKAVEIKTGNVGASAGAQKWRLTIGQPGKAETALQAKMTPAALTALNAAKRQAILDRKAKAVANIAKAAGVPIEAQTVTVLLDHDRRLADVHVLDGFHEVIRWNSPSAHAAYVGTYAY